MIIILGLIIGYVSNLSNTRSTSYNQTSANVAEVNKQAPFPAFGTELTGKVVGVHDGDTLTLLVDGRQQVKIRLSEIDAPEMGQPYGEAAKQALSALAFGKAAVVQVVDTDRYGRTVGRVFVDGIDVNAELVRKGAVWVYGKYAKDASLSPLQDQARAEKRGLWALPEGERVPPWEWRREGKGGGAAVGATPAPASPAQSSAGGFTCGNKRTCREMTSCAEARFYLEHCGLKRLDRDKDGVPCKVLCR